jgi:hypothetical protein
MRIAKDDFHFHLEDERDWPPKKSWEADIGTRRVPIRRSEIDCSENIFMNDPY